METPWLILAVMRRPQVLVASCIWRERATLPLGVHPLAVGHPPGSGLGPVLADGEWMNPCLSQTLTVALLHSRSILEPEAPPEATESRSVTVCPVEHPAQQQGPAPLP